MSPREAETLLGGYAAGILTEQERTSLFAAALENQQLFDALADEEALRSLLADPRARAELLRAVTEQEQSGISWGAEQQEFATRAMAPAAAPSPRPAHEGKPVGRASWWSAFLRPAPVAGLGAIFLALAGLVVVMRPDRKAEVREMAKARNVELPTPQAASVREPEPAPAPTRAATPAKATRKPAPPAEIAPSADRADTNAIRDGEKAKLAKDSAAPPASPLPADVQAAAAPPPPPAVAPEPRMASNEAGEAKRAEKAEARRMETANQAPGVGGGTVGRLSGLSRTAAKIAQAPLLPMRLELDGKATGARQFPAASRVRLVVTPGADGSLSTSIDGQTSPPVAVRAGRDYRVPSRGWLPSGVGERIIQITLQPASGEAITVSSSVEFR